MKKAVLAGIAMLCCMVSFSQIRFGGNPGSPSTTRQNNQDPQKKFYFGGGGGLGFGTGYNYYSLFPIAGYRVTDQFSVGTGVTYQRYNYTNYSTGNYSYTQYGVMPFMRYNFNPLFFQTEYDLINAPTVVNYELVRQYHSRLLFGIGYMVPMGRRGALNALVMYDVLYKTGSVFGNSPVVARVFFTL